MPESDGKYVTFYGVWITVPLEGSIKQPAHAYDFLCDVLAAEGIEWNTDQSTYVTGDGDSESPGGRTRDLWPKEE